MSHEFLIAQGEHCLNKLRVYTIVLAMQDNVQREVNAWRSQLRKGTLELAVLLALRKQRCYGLQLVDLLNAANLGISEGSIYPVLSRLRAEKKVQSEWVDSGVGHAHKYYELTAHGRTVLEAMLIAWEEFSEAFDGLTGKGGTRDVTAKTRR